MDFNGQYLTYDEYKALGGNLDQTPFNLLEYEARKIIDSKTQQRLKEIEQIPQEVKLCTLSLISMLSSYTKGNQTRKNISSESVGSYSVSYATIQEIIKSKNAELTDVVFTYLTGVIVNEEHLVYLGVN